MRSLVVRSEGSVELDHATVDNDDLPVCATDEELDMVDVPAVPSALSVAYASVMLLCILSNVSRNSSAHSLLISSRVRSSNQPDRICIASWLAVIRIADSMIATPTSTDWRGSCSMDDDESPSVLREPAVELAELFDVLVSGAFPLEMEEERDATAVLVGTNSTNASLMISCP